MTRIAVFSDVHADRRAMLAILAGVRKAGIDRLWCLGDFCSGGFEPAETFDLVMDNAEVVLAGNHEAFVLWQVWRDVQSGWAQAALEAFHDLGRARVARLHDLHSHAITDDCELVHGALTNPTSDFLLGAGTAHSNLGYLNQTLLLFGHTHAPVVWAPHKNGRWAREVPFELGRPVPLPDPDDRFPRRLINPGAGCDGAGARWAELDLTPGARSVTFHQEAVGGHNGVFSESPHEARTAIASS